MMKLYEIHQMNQIVEETDYSVITLIKSLNSILKRIEINSEYQYDELKNEIINCDVFIRDEENIRKLQVMIIRLQQLCV